jgi:Raf kinase inhibitor-like YbhB/YbcL family protein
MKMPISAALVAAMLGLATAPAACAQPPVAGAEPGAAMLAINTLTAKADGKLVVTSPAFRNESDIPFENTSYRGSVFPGMGWTRGPYGTRTFAIVMQDDDALYKGAPILHWTMYDIPGNVRSLAVGMPTMPPGSSYGPNIAGPHHVYMGPHTPPGPRHHYHFQVFALDVSIAPAPIASYADLIGAMTGHVLASGQLVGLGRVDPDAPPRPAPPAPAPAPPH